MIHLNTVHIPSGTIRFDTRKNELYQAFLGTCVGVALYDHVSGIGGMIHILLPKPPSDYPPEFPEKYASTGLPILIKELLNLGAYRENLMATIAGGALVGPLSHMDINLDIGGRSTEIALDILKQENIKVMHSETGGFFTCTLELDMTTGEATVKPAWNGNTQSIPNASVPTLKEIAKTIEGLKPIPQAALKILRMIDEDQFDTGTITEELIKDQVLSARTLQLCNSVMFAPRHPVETLNDAVVILGTSHLIKSVITAAIRSYFDQREVSGYSLCKGGIFYHAVGCGIAAERIAHITGKAALNIAYTAGLLHDIGKVVLDQYIAKAYPLFFRGIDSQGASAMSMEKKLLGTTHSIAGMLLAKNWNFSGALTEVIRHHHNPEMAKDHKDLVRIVYIADLLMSRFNTGLELEKMKTTNLHHSLKALELSADDIPRLIDAIPLITFDPKNHL